MSKKIQASDEARYQRKHFLITFLKEVSCALKTVRSYLRKSFFLLVFSMPFFSNMVAEERTPRLLVLVLASENFPIYTELQKVWRSYMHYDPEHVETYFIKGDPELSAPFLIDGDIIWSKTKEGFIGETSALIDKTIYSMEAIYDRLADFDYVLRTNLSSFYVFPRLLEQLKTLPKTGCYFASSTDDSNKEGSGCGFILSTDVVRLLVQHKHEMIHRLSPPDDCIVARFLAKCGIYLLPHSRQDLLTKADFLKHQHAFPENMFHFRIKTEDHLRLEDDIYIHNNLLKMFYKE